MAEEPYRGSQFERIDQLRSRGYPPFVPESARKAWVHTLKVLAENGQIMDDDPITPKNWAAANRIFQNTLRKMSPDVHEAERQKQVAERARNMSIDPYRLAGFNKRKREEIIAFDLGNWYLTRAGLMSHDERVTQRMYFDTPFVRVMPHDDAPTKFPYSPNKLIVQPLFCWTIEIHGEYGLEGKSIHKITQDVARWLVRDHPEVAGWMAAEMTGALALLDEAVSDVEHEMPTVGGIDVIPSVLDHRGTKDFIHEAREEIEAAISALPIRR